MKESGLPWIGEIPEHWGLTRIETLFSEGLQKNIFYEFDHALKFTYGNLVPKNEEGDVSELKGTYLAYSIIDENDIAINGLNLNFDFVSQRVARCPQRGILTSAYLILKPNDVRYSRYYTYQFKSWDNQKVFHGMGKGVRLTLSFSEVEKMLMPIPPLSEQQDIADFLDKKIGEIENAIKEANELIDKYKSYKQSIITEAVTKGIQPDIPMKDSGVEWIGDVPNHWKVCAFKREITIYNGKDYKDFMDDEIYPVIGSGGCFTYCSKYMYDGEALLMGRKGTIDKPLYINGKFWAVDTMFYAIPKKNLNCKFAYYLALTFPYNLYSTSTTLPSMTQTDLGNNPVAIPPFTEQQAIVDYLDEKCTKIDSIIESKNNLIKQLQEYKKSIIFEYVTGKKEVPNG